MRNRGFLPSGLVTLTGVLTAAVLAAGPAQAQPLAEAAPPAAPTDVRIGWADATHQFVKVTWSDNGEANELTAVPQNGQPDTYKTTAIEGAGKDNEILLDRWWFDGNYAAVRLEVVSIAGGERSAPGLSVPFDTHRPPQTLIQRAIPWTDGRVQLAWTQDAVPADQNLGDPLDVLSDPERVSVGLGSDHSAPSRFVAVPRGARSMMVPAVMRPPYELTVLGSNEWGNQEPPRRVNIREMGIGARIPAAATYGTYLDIRGPGGIKCGDSSAPACYYTPERFGQIVPVPYQVQARANASSPWAVVTTGRDIRAIRPAVMAIGTRQLRFVVPTWSPTVPSTATAWMATPPVTARTTFRLATAGINHSSPLRTGGKMVAQLNVAPKVSTKALWQRWDGKAWVGLAWVPLRNGLGTKTLTATKPGYYAYRFVVPATTYQGRRIETTVSPKTYLRVF
ncbi:hypothetical protein [Kribbella deserti]|uniref:Uncharacterized protein n=1 Tax=Kribbella deserti TaxID=1926257 RepID=A0ABV6QUU7_9ACTN